MTIFLRKCTTGGPQVDRSVDKLTAFVSIGERTRRGVRAARPLSSQLGTVARTPTNVSVAAHRRHDYAGVVICGGDTSRPAIHSPSPPTRIAPTRLVRDGV